MVQRYAHLSSEHLQQHASVLDNIHLVRHKKDTENTVPDFKKS